MENASKALLIAGGMLLTMLVVSLLILLSNNINAIGQAQEEKIASEQLAMFNSQYEAYNKKLLYGTDVITVMNKAIENNLNINQSNTNYFIDVEVKVIDGYATTTVVETVNANGGVSSKVVTRGTVLGKNKTYNLLKSGTTHIDQDIIDFFNTPVTDPAPIVTDGGKTITHTYNALTDFKRAIFKCDSVHYNSNTGRIDKITFSQKQLAEY